MKHVLKVVTRRHVQLREITSTLHDLVASHGPGSGICLMFCPHTTAGLLINENADPDVASDLERAFSAITPNVQFDHAEANSSSHWLSALAGSSLHLIIDDHRLQLGPWQGIFFCEFDGPRQREVWVTFSPQVP